MSIDETSLQTRPTEKRAPRLNRRRKTWLSIGAFVVVAGLLAGYFLQRPSYAVVREDSYQVTSATASQLEESADLKVFFGHQSVGANLLEAVPAVYSSAGLAGPEIVASEQPQTSSEGGYLQHVFVGENGDPLGKIAEFDRIIRGGVGNEVDIAALKLCYVDLHSGDDVDGVFEAYRDTLAALQRDYPEVTFVYMTVPLTTEQGIKNRVKDRLGFNAPYGPEHNIAREQFNAKIRAEFAGSGRLFDIAAIQSTALDGTREVHSYGGAEYYAMVDELSKDPGHLTPEASAMIASAFLGTFASVSNADSR